MALSALHPNELGYQDAFEYEDSFWFLSTRTPRTTSVTLSLTQGQSTQVAQNRTRVFTLAATQAQNVTLARVQAIIRTLSLAQASSSTVLRRIAPTKIIAQGQNAVVARATTRTVVTSNGQNIALTRQTLRSRLITQAQAITIGVNRPFTGRTFNVVQTQSVQITRTALETKRITQGSSAIVNRSIQRSLSVAQSESAFISRLVSYAILIGQAQLVSISRQSNKALLVFQTTIATEQTVAIRAVSFVILQPSVATLSDFSQKPIDDQIILVYVHEPNISIAQISLELTTPVRAAEALMLPFIVQNVDEPHIVISERTSSPTSIIDAAKAPSVEPDYSLGVKLTEGRFEGSYG